MRRNRHSISDNVSGGDKYRILKFDKREGFAAWFAESSRNNSEIQSTTRLTAKWYFRELYDQEMVFI